MTIDFTPEPKVVADLYRAKRADACAAQSALYMQAAFAKPIADVLTPAAGVGFGLHRALENALR